MVKLLCAIVGEQGSAFPVDIDASQLVGDLKDAIKAKIDYSGQQDLSSPWRRRAQDGYQVSLVDTKRERYSTYSLRDVLETNGMPPPQTRQIHVLVVVPPLSVWSKRSADDENADVLKRLKLLEESNSAAVKAKTLTNFAPLSVHEDEFRLDSLSIVQQSDNPVEVMFWEVIKKQLFGKDRIVIVGSPGVGKSCFLMLVAFYLACIKRKKVLVIRRLKEPTLKNAVVFFDGQGSYARLTNLSQIDIRAIRHQVTSELVDGKFDKKEVPIVLVDGFNQAQVDDSNSEYGPFRLLATSCQFDAKQDDSSRIVVLPAWRDADLLQYAKSTNWVTETGLRQIKRQDTPFPRLVKEQYFYSGGSLREFCRNRRSLLERVTSDCCAVANDQAFELVYNYGGGQSRSQVDRIRRHFITDCNREVDYYDRLWWKLSVDSGYVLSQLGRKIDTDKQLEVYKYAKSVGAGFHGVAYEQLLHNAVLTTCEAFPSKDGFGNEGQNLSTKSETIVAYIQVTIRSEKTFKEKRLFLLNEELDKNPLLKNMKRAFVIVGPDSGICEMFDLKGAPDANTFLTMISCFNPEQLKRNMAHSPGQYQAGKERIKVYSES
ncbi:putative P-loop containing nucleoside triphosphate hydrolase [Plasmopara halstedii]